MVPSSRSEISFDLVLVALLGEGPERFGLGDLAADELLLVAGELLHLLFDSRKVGLGDRRRGIDVVVEAVLDGGADAELDARVERFEGLGQQVRRVCQKACLPSSSSHL